MVLRDAIVVVRPVPCGTATVATIAGVRCSLAMAAFLADGSEVWSTNALDLQAALRRFGYRMRFAEGFPDPCPALEDWLEYDREPVCRALPLVVAVEEDAAPRHWIAVWRTRLATDGRWERIEDMALSRWAVRAAWWVGRR